MLCLFAKSGLLLGIQGAIYDFYSTLPRDRRLDRTIRSNDRLEKNRFCCYAIDSTSEYEECVKNNSTCHVERFDDTMIYDEKKKQKTS